ncbi:hypothetical protein J6590_010784 [Homalodisca vitripennis]|nr:hypothetical protein J6590_010784 [Homalodisca vitripennis]
MSYQGGKIILLMHLKAFELVSKKSTTLDSSLPLRFLKFRSDRKSGHQLIQQHEVGNLSSGRTGRKAAKFTPQELHRKPEVPEPSRNPTSLLTCNRSKASM